MIINRLFRLLAFLLGGLTFLTLLTIGLWSARHYRAIPDWHSEGLAPAGYGAVVGFPQTMGQGMHANRISVVGVWVGLYVFSLSAAFLLFRQHFRYLMMTAAVMALLASWAIRYCVDQVLVVALSPAFLFLLARGIAVGPGWEKR